jgi:glycine dehydrogenase
MTAHRKPADEPAASFVRRHIGPSPRDVAAMLETVGAGTLGELMSQTLPASIRQKTPLELAAPLSETEALAHMRELASRNQVFTSMIGQGYSGTILPPVIQRNILENPAWYTAYTPYQPEISQGRLEALFNFQTMVCDLTDSMSPMPRCLTRRRQRPKRWRWRSAPRK